MVLSLDDLPYDANGGLTGKWLVQLQDEINSFHAGVRWELGRSIEPITGLVLRRFIAASLKVRGAIRVEGEPVAVGDVSTLLEHAPPEARPVKAPEKAAPEKHAVSPALPEKPLVPATGVLEPSSAPIEPGPVAEPAAPAPAAALPTPVTLPEPLAETAPAIPNALKSKKERR